MAVTAAEVPQRPRTRPTRNGGFAVNDPLTAKPRREAAEVGAAIDRMMRALVRRAASGDLEALRELHRLRGQLIQYTGQAARVLNGDHGYSWAEIGRATSRTRQAAQQMWGT